MAMHANSPSRRITALISLITILLIYAPIASATLMAVTGTRCTGDQYPIHGTHQPSKEPPAQRSDDSPTDCDHHDHGANKTQSCSMSCCHNGEQPAVHAHIFLLTPLSLDAELAPLSLASLSAAPKKFSSVFAPLAPPPKSSAN